MLRLRHGVGDENLVNARGIDASNGVAAEDTVGKEGVNLESALSFQQLGGTGDGVGRVDDVIDKDADAVCNVANKHHTGVALLGKPSGTAFLRVLHEFWTGGGF